MVRYELAFVYKAIENQQLINSIKETVSYILKKGCNVRGIQSLGQRSLPYTMTDKKEKEQTDGNFIIMDVDFPQEELLPIQKYLVQLEDILRISPIRYDKVYKNIECDGWQQVDYHQLLENLKTQNRRPAKELKKPFGDNWI